AAYIFSGDPNVSVQQVMKLDGGIADATITEIGALTQFGRRVAIAGDFALIGAPESGKGPANNTDQITGRAYLFHRNDNGTTQTSDDTWSLIATLAPPETDDDSYDYFGHGVAISEDASTIVIGAQSHEGFGGGGDQGAAYVYSFDQNTGTVTLEGRIRAANRTNSDLFGRYVSVNEDGSVIAISMILDDDLDGDSGSVHVYSAAGSDWGAFFSGAPTEDGVLSVNSDGVKLKPISEKTDVESDNFGRAIALSGNRLVVGAFDDDFPDDNNGSGTFRDRGSAYVYEYDMSGVHSVLDLDAPVEGNGKAQIAVHATLASGITQVEVVTGAALAVTESAGVVTITLGTSGSSANDIVAAIGSAGIAGFTGELFLGNGAVNSVLGGNDGSGVVTVASGLITMSQWQLQQKLVADNNGQDDAFGWGVDIDGDTIVVGANQEDSNSATVDNNSSTNSGSVYIFEFNSGAAAGAQWEQVQRIKASDQQAHDHFGRSVAIDDGLIVVGAYLEDTSGSEAGAIYVFQKDGGAAPGSQWSQLDVVRAPDGSSRDGFGLSVGISQGNIVAGAYYQDRVLADGTVIANFGGAHAYRVEGAVSVSSVTQPAKGVVTTDGTTITFDPDGAFEDLGFGESEVVTFTYNNGTEDIEVAVTVTGVNDAPTVTLGGNQSVVENSGAHTVSNFATGFDPVEPGQSVLEYVVSNDNNGLFAVQPTIDVNGELT
ncbi:MAG: hypothetical protein KDM64_12780, partial [Verrucomicrobiae bacterium]|nr:hypothetical protein [Verrucomicrobiae bacterium]